jgi:16S rRNA (cytidine1402-2'-O)-methyltransferase
MAGKHGEAGRGRLYVVATPIGNLGDLTQRAIATLGAVHVVFAEDTRHTRGLLAHHGIAAKLAALHEHNEREAAGELVRHLEEGRDVALVTDAGTPAISDPGAHAVAAARAAGFDVVPIPGPNAAIAALSVAGVPGPFAFVGFLPPKPSARRKALQAWRGFPHTLVLYEAPHRILECVDDLARVLGPDRAVVLARELTKAFETVHACALGAARGWLEADPDRTRGEFVVIVSGAGAPDEPRGAEGERVLRLLVEAVPVRTAVQLAAAITGGSRNELYAQALALKQGAPPAAGKRRKGRKAREG